MVRIRRKLPLRIVLTIPFILEIIAAVGLTGYLSWRNGQQAVNKFAFQLEKEIGNRIQQELETYLETPQLMNCINTDVIHLRGLHIKTLITEFMEQINDNTRSTFLLCMLALAGVMIIGLLTAHWIAQPILGFSKAAEAIANGELNQQIEADIPIRELDMMVRSFNQMAEKVPQSFEQVKQALQKSEEKFTQVFTQQAELLHLAHDAIIVRDPENRIIFWNRGAEQLYGWTMKDVRQQVAHELLKTQFPTSLEKVNAQLFIQEFWEGELIHTKRDGIPIIVESRQVLTRDRTGQLTAILEINRDISDRKRTEDQIRASLQEKEVLLSEIHHRVKNNLQIISSLLVLQVNRTSDPQTREALEDSRDRVNSIALVHEQLYRAQNFAEINFSEYIQQLVNQLLYTYRPTSDAITLNIKVDPNVSISLNQAIPCGLLLNELVTNAFKHGFPSDISGQLYIWLEALSNNQLRLLVGNDGDRLPAQFDLSKASSMGLRLVTTLVKQLNGTIELERGDKTLFKITFEFNNHGQDKS
jgi:PAS domain S-box-containing protein